MSVCAGKYTYKNHDIAFWLTPKTIKVTIWKKDTLILVKRMYSRNNDYAKLRKRVISLLDSSIVDGHKYIAVGSALITNSTA